MSFRTELRRTPRTLYKIIAVPLFFLPSLVLAWLRVRFVTPSLYTRIGHIAVEPDCYLKDMRLGRVPFSRPVMLVVTRPANQFLMDCWRQHFTVVSNRILANLLQPFELFPYLHQNIADYAGPVKVTAGAYTTYAAWGDRPPVLPLPPDAAARGEAVLRRMGIPEGGWYVCIHPREPGYSPEDDAVNAYRNASIESYRLAMETIVARGGWCVRMGDASTPAIAAPMYGVIDYSHSEYRSDWMDIFLAARCRFFLGSTSGLFLAASIFGVPVALTNMTPLGCAYGPTPADLSIPKLVVDDSGACLTFMQVLTSPIGDHRSTGAFVADGVRMIDNTPEEIRDLVVEMIERLEKRAVYDAEDEKRQAAFRRLLRPGHYSYGAASRMGRDFLRQHADLIGEPKENSADHRRLPG